MRTCLLILLPAILLLAALPGQADAPRTINHPNTIWRYTNLPPDGREARLVEESKADAGQRAAARQAFGKQELINMVSDVALRHGVEPELLCAIAWTESRFNPYVVSAKGAEGLMQLMPATARKFGVTDAKNPIDNAEGGARYLRWLLAEYDDDLVLALAAYNAGSGAVKKGGTVPPFSQTRNFVTSVLTMRDHFRNR
ncbi:MAG TPA: lytic transglycosylase domain-containing protein [bacterium]|nr:lytic transglycosylase domain-containing protein [bacterium]